MTNIEVPGLPGSSHQLPVMLNVLSVDDDEIDRLRLNTLCRKAGLTFSFHEAANLQDMQRKLDAEPFDLVFLDHNLGMDTGLDALQVLQAHADQVQALPIMLTSSTNYQIAVQAMRQGCADFIVKDELTVDALIKSVASAIERRALYGELSAARSSEAELKKVFDRFLMGCGPEIRVLLRRMLASVRAVKSQARDGSAVDPAVLSDVSLLERSCKDLVVFMDDLETVLRRGREIPGTRPPGRLQ